MIEQAMIFALGFLVAGLAALAFAPAFWRRADRLTRRRLEMQMPLSVQEILAERDQLRAEFAVERCRLDQHAARLTERHAADLAELGRRTAEIYKLTHEIAEVSAALQEAERDRAEKRQQFLVAQAELGGMHKALYDADGLLERRQEELVEQRRLQESMKLLADMRHAALAAAEARVASLELRLGDVSRNVLETEHKFVEKERHARNLADVLAATRKDLEIAEAKIARLRERSEAEALRAAQASEELVALRQKHDAELTQLRTLMVKMNVNEAALEDARRREKELLAQREQIAERAREAERSLSDKYFRLSSEYAAAQGALQAARQRCQDLETLLARHAPADAQKAAFSAAEEDSRLRQSISEIGAALVELMRPSNGEPASPGFRDSVAPFSSSAGTEEAVTGVLAAGEEAVTS